MKSADVSFSMDLRLASEGLWLELVEHRFVREMSEGTLPLEKFVFYVEQNLLYLPEYARAIAFGAAKSDSREELQAFATSLSNVLSVEIDENERLLSRASGLLVTRSRRASELAPNALSYTSYLMAVSATGTPTEILAAILPCAWSYGDIGLALEPKAVNHPVYAEWIGFFASDEYGEVVRSVRGRFDAATAGVGAEVRSRLAGIFHTAMRLEKGFWDMGYDMQEWRGTDRGVVN